MTLPGQTTVLIVGAGPSGMAAALALKTQGINDIVIVDGLLAGENTSRAMVIQAATLEALDTVGCAEEILTVGRKAEQIGLIEGSSNLISADFSLLSSYTKYPFGVVLPQPSTEAAMLSKLDQFGIKVWRPFRVASLKPSSGPEDKMVNVHFESGDIIQARYVIGADGAHSVIRHEAGIAFKDPNGNEKRDYGNLSQMVFGDVAFSSPLKLPTPFITIVEDPDPTRPVHRFVCGVPKADGDPPHAPTTEYIQSLIDRCGPHSLSSDPAINPQPTRIEKTYWSSRYRTRCASADRFLWNQPNGGTVLLIGDAAHIHSPIGGQGMSLGIRDAISLGRVLKLRLDSATEGAVSEELLEEWAAGRRQRALSVIALTERTMGVITAQTTIWSPLRRLAFAFLRFASRFKFFQRLVAYRFSGLDEI
ncbi:hypothetical protein C8F04DRAFT_1124121 [Mycena alexandri]|uniref:FAD-binding domain-containing protein n=1 Tax=Mycena alexandri TaxID=1745969 RepID=A0AAD6SFP4_9AGAR|nr:hypothetical protein C8F04DRAFT_1124121 [Mycena alexandri]